MPMPSRASPAMLAVEGPADRRQINHHGERRVTGLRRKVLNVLMQLRNIHAHALDGERVRLSSWSREENELQVTWHLCPPSLLNGPIFAKRLGRPCQNAFVIWRQLFVIS